LLKCKSTTDQLKPHSPESGQPLQRELIEVDCLSAEREEAANIDNFPSADDPVVEAELEDKLTPANVDELTCWDGSDADIREIPAATAGIAKFFRPEATFASDVTWAKSEI